MVLIAGRPVRPAYVLSRGIMIDVEFEQAVRKLEAFLSRKRGRCKHEDVVNIVKEITGILNELHRGFRILARILRIVEREYFGPRAYAIIRLSLWVEEIPEWLEKKVEEYREAIEKYCKAIGFSYRDLVSKLTTLLETLSRRAEEIPVEEFLYCLRIGAGVSTGKEILRLLPRETVIRLAEKLG